MKETYQFASLTLMLLLSGLILLVWGCGVWPRYSFIPPVPSSSRFDQPSPSDHRGESRGSFRKTHRGHRSGIHTAGPQPLKRHVPEVERLSLARSRNCDLSPRSRHVLQEDLK